jgi:hypothetical protein
MEDRITEGLYLEMTDAMTPDEYAQGRVGDVLALGGVERATWWRNLKRDRHDLPRVLDEFDTLGVYEVDRSFTAPTDLPAGVSGHHFWRTPRPGQGRLTGRPTIGLSLVLISPTDPARAQELRDWGDFVHISWIAAVGTPGYTMITPYEHATGGDLDEIVAMLDARVQHTRVFGMIDTMESLRRGGRVSWAQFGIGTLLQIKPVMMITAGEISIEAKVRTRKRALKKMQEMVSAYLPFERIAVLHVNAPEAAEQLCEESKSIFPEGTTPIIQGVGPAIGTHLGIGAVGFAAISSINE